MKSALRSITCSFFFRRFIQVVLSASVPALFGQPANVDLPDAAKGDAAIEVLGKNLPAVASFYGLHPNELAHLLKVQRSLGVDKKGALLYACDGLAVTASGALVNGSAASGGDVTANMMPPNSSVTAIANGEAVDAFKLHSLPGITRVIYLDFDGHTTTGTLWNSSQSSIVSAPFDLDGSPGTFSAAERSMIQKIWQRVAEDYAPFSVDVTTEDPGVEGLRKTTSGDTAFGIRVVISPTNWYNTGAGGVAYIGSFNWNSDTPCFAFTQQLANGEKYIAECVSHEAGHTVGLNHDGLSGAGATEYYQGQGNWAPIMGVGYYKPIVQFSKGEYANANNTQDDLSVMTSYIPLAADDHGNTPTILDATLISGPNVNVGGTIETRNDVDVFRIVAGAGALSLTVQGPAPDTNLDAKAELLNAAGQVVLTSDSTSALGASLVTNVAAGTYYVRISGVGNGDPVTNGYSSYASIGNYLITGSFQTGGVNQPPTAEAAATPTSGMAPLTVSFTSWNSSDSDGTIVSRSWVPAAGMSPITEPASFTYTNPGTYTATLSVVDNGGLVGTASVVITVTAPTNVLPTAVVSADKTSGYAPLAVAFGPGSGTGDTDGTIQSYFWEFGDGTTSTQQSPQKTYTTPGTFSAKLTVTDNRGGATTSSPVAINVQQNPDNKADVSSLNLSAATAKNGTTVAAAIEVRNSLGQAVANATVTIQWSGAVGGTSSGTTNSSGKLTLTSAKTRKTGLETATVTSVTPPTGYQFAPSLYPADSASITLK